MLCGSFLHPASWRRSERIGHVCWPDAPWLSVVLPANSSMEGAGRPIGVDDCDSVIFPSLDILQRLNERRRAVPAKLLELASGELNTMRQLPLVRSATSLPPNSPRPTPQVSRQKQPAALPNVIGISGAARCMPMSRAYPRYRRIPRLACGSTWKRDTTSACCNYLR